MNFSFAKWSSCKQHKFLFPRVVVTLTWRRKIVVSSQQLCRRTWPLSLFLSLSTCLSVSVSCSEEDSSYPHPKKNMIKHSATTWRPQGGKEVLLPPLPSRNQATTSLRQGKCADYSGTKREHRDFSFSLLPPFPFVLKIPEALKSHRVKINGTQTHFKWPELWGQMKGVLWEHLCPVRAFPPSGLEEGLKLGLSRSRIGSINREVECLEERTWKSCLLWVFRPCGGCCIHLRW